MIYNLAHHRGIVKNPIRIFLFLFVAYMSISPAFSATWNGGLVNNLASNPENWVGKVHPQNGDDIIFDDTSTMDCTWDLDETYFSLTIDGGYTGVLTLESTLTLKTLTYTVTYDGNGNDGGSIPIDNTDYLQGSTVITLGNTGGLAKSGYEFYGWNTQADGNGMPYSPGQTFTMGSADVTLYAKWVTTCTAPDLTCLDGTAYGCTVTCVSPQVCSILWDNRYCTPSGTPAGSVQCGCQ